MKLRKSLPVLTFGFGLTFGIAIGIGMLVGFKSASQNQTETDQSLSAETATRLLHAASANSGKSLAMATGKIDDEVEGVFVLDFLTGDLYCWVLNPRALGAGFIGQYKQNILGDLGLEKGKAPDYILATGNIQAVRGADINRPAETIIYVGDGNSGNVVAYGVPWNPTLRAAGRPQGGPMIRVGVGKARPILEAN